MCIRDRVGFAAGIAGGVFFLKKGYSLKRTHKMPLTDGISLPVIQIGLLVLLITAPAFIFFSESGPGSMPVSYTHLKRPFSPKAAILMTVSLRCV